VTTPYFFFFFEFQNKQIYFFIAQNGDESIQTTKTIILHGSFDPNSDNNMSSDIS
jgi:hypothetical protein